MNKPKTGVVLAALLAILLFAAFVCTLHGMNAVSTRGQVAVGDCLVTDGTAQALVPLVEDPWTDRGIIHIEGALLRMNQSVGAVNVRVGLIPKGDEEEVLLLNTQMVRRSDLAQQYGCDDHCGFHAVVEHGLLEGAGRRFGVVLVDTVEGEQRLMDIGMMVVAIDGGLAVARKHQPKEAQDAK